MYQSCLSFARCQRPARLVPAAAALKVDAGWASSIAIKVRYYCPVTPGSTVDTLRWVSRGRVLQYWSS